MDQMTSELQALDDLLSSRENAMPLTTKMERRFVGMSIDDIDEYLVSNEPVPSRVSRAASLVRVRRVAADHQSDGSEDVRAALSAFCDHLASCSKDVDQPEQRRLVLAGAAAHISGSLGGDDDDGRVMVASPPEAWRESIGMGEGRFVLLLSQALGLSLQQLPASEVPRWLKLRNSAPDLLLSSVRLWDDIGIASNFGVPELQDRIDTAWAAYVDGRIAMCDELLEDVRAAAGTVWGPGDSVESQHLWNWVRFVRAASDAVSAPVGRRRRLLTAKSLFERMPIGDQSVVPYPWVVSEVLVSDILRDLGPGDAEIEGSWAVYTARLAPFVDDHEPIVEQLDNNHRAALRGLWRLRFAKILGGSTKTTQEIYLEIGKAYIEVLDEISRAIRESGEFSATSFFQLSNRVAPFLDAFEADLLDRAASLIGDVESRTVDSVLTRGDLAALELEMNDHEVQIHQAGSLLLAEIVLPHLARARTALSGAFEQHADAAPAQIAIDVPHRRFRLAATGRGLFDIQLQVHNPSEVAVTALSLRPDCPSLEFEEGTVFVGELDPGVEVSVGLTATVASPCDRCDLVIEATWSDDLERDYEESLAFALEAERETRWAENTVNPFSLGAITTRERLVGRDEDLARLKDLVMAAQSTSVTGHKRVGKTSVVRVLLKSLPPETAAGRRIALGRALSADPSASELVFALLMALHKAIVSSWPQHVITEPDITRFDRNFAQAADEWLTDVSDTLPEEKRVVLIIDDFDELPSVLILGEEGEALFRFLRTLIEELWLSVVFVGSEVLPAIITGRHNVKLNTVSESPISEFTSPQATRELLVGASSGQLDWDDAAIARIHTLSNGNPYYSTLLGSGIWATLRSQDRAEVRVSDVDAAVSEISSIRTDGHFVHFWSDGPEGMDVASDASVASAAALLGITLSAATFKGGWAPFPSAVNLAREFLVSASRATVEEAVKRLENRRVIESSADRRELRITVPLLGEWIRGPGGRSVLDGLFATSSLGRDNTTVIPPRQIFDMSENWHFQGERVSDIRIQAWLDQFSEGWERFTAFRLLTRLRDLGFYGPDRLETEVFPSLARQITRGDAGRLQRFSKRSKGGREYRENFFVLQGKKGSSAAVANRKVSAALKIRKSQGEVTLDRLDRVVEAAGRDKHSVLVAVDDFSGTGRQATRLRNDIAASLDQLDQGWADRVLVVIGVGLAADPTSLKAIEMDGVTTAYGLDVPTELMATSPDAQIFDTGEFDRAYDLIEAFGRQLQPDAPFGFGDDALLLSFSDNCPNNTLPIFWSDGEVNRKKWLPLLPRR